MSNSKFSIGEAISFGWDAFKENWGLLLSILFVPAIIGQTPTIFNSLTDKEFPLVFVVLSIVFALLSAVFTMGQMKIFLKLVDNEETGFGDLFSCFHLFFKYLVGGIAYGFIVIFGLILFIIPGIIWAIKYKYFLYLIIDKEMGPFAAIKQSGVITQGAKWNLFLFGLVLSGVVLLGLLALCIGVFVAIPVVVVAGAFVYRKLQPKVEPKPVNPFLARP